MLQRECPCLFKILYAEEKISWPRQHLYTTYEMKQQITNFAVAITACG